MNFIKNYINENISFIKGTDNMDKIDYLVYIIILGVLLFITWKYESKVCILKINIRQVIRLILIGLRFVITSTLIYNFYRAIRISIK